MIVPGVLEADVSAADLVSVAPFTPIPLAPPTGPAMSTKALAWLGDSWSTLGMFALAGVSLVMLRSVVRGVPSQVSPQPAAGYEENQAVLPMSANPVEAGEAASAKSRLRRRASTGPSLRDDLVELVRERRAQHVARELLPRRRIGSGSAHRVLTSSIQWQTSPGRLAPPAAAWQSINTVKSTSYM